MSDSLFPRIPITQEFTLRVLIERCYDKQNEAANLLYRGLHELRSFMSAKRALPFDISSLQVPPVRSPLFTWSYYSVALPQSKEPSPTGGHMTHGA
jgi:hypothetical protein